MYKIYYCDLDKATGNSEIKRRPVVSVGFVDEAHTMVKVYKITSRMKHDKYHVRMNNYIIRGFCDISEPYIIDKKYLLGWQRDCTTSEVKAINNRIRACEG